MIEKLFELAIKKGASDLHILPGLPPLLRINGELTKADDIPSLSPDESKALIYSLLSDEEQQAFEKNLLDEMSLAVPNIGNFRVSIFHQLKGIAGVFRVIPGHVPSLEEIGLPAIFKKLLALPHGLILITGPTGSGKSTTLAAMIDYINVLKSAHIITIEDPIEFIHTGKKSAITQLQIGRDTPNAAAALKGSLRQDPDVILLGEMRDLETINLALTAAETGHLVMATLHAGSAPLAVSRIVDVFPVTEKNRVRNLLSETLQAIICQTLVKRTEGGRVAAFEIMLATPAIRHLIRQDMIAHMETAIQTSGDVGMCTLEQYLQELVNKRVITPFVARTVIQHRGSFKPE